jgi:Protein of unknown function (DUF3489)
VALDLAGENECVTKQERMLTLLSRPEGANIEEMMQATDWQQHTGVFRLTRARLLFERPGTKNAP